MGRASTRVLSMHAGYGCRQRGVCCAAGWPVPVEAPVERGLRTAIDRQALTLRTGAQAFEPDTGQPPETGAHLARPDGRCVFFDDPTCSCRVHAALGHEALPLACRQFPRITVCDPRGASVTLSHYCPTAAEMLDDDHDVAILPDADGFPPTGEYVGLDTRAGVPPLLRPDMAMDWESWWACEEHGVATLADGAVPIDDALARLGGAVEHLRTWTPSEGSLLEGVERAFSQPGPAGPSDGDDVLIEDVRQAIPDDLRPAARLGAGSAETRPRAHRRFLAAHAFANWTAHLGLGLRAWFASIETAHALLVAGHTVGEADLWLRHLADPRALATAWSRRETTSRP